MNPTSSVPIAGLLTAVTLLENAVLDDPRFEQVLNEVFASVAAGDHDNATRVVRESLHRVCASAAAAQAGVLTGPVLDEAARIFTDGFVRRRGRPGFAEHDDHFRTPAAPGFAFLNLTARQT